MSSGRWTFTKKNLKRAIVVAHEAGLHVRGIRPDGTLLTSNYPASRDDQGDTPQLDKSGEVNHWDENYGTEPTEARSSDPKPER
jgi:hypothetical protein